MKKYLFFAMFCLTTAAVNAQLIRTEDLEKYSVEKYGEKWVDAAANLVESGEVSLDKNNSLTYVEIIDCGEQTKEQLYVNLNYWFTATFNDANSVIKLNDKEAGVIIGQGYIQGIAGHAGGMNTYLASIKPIIKADIKDKKVRITYTIQGYHMTKAAGGGIVGALAGARPTVQEELWHLEEHYPFVKKDSQKKISSKALVMSHAFSYVLMDKINEAVKEGLVGNEADEW